MFQETWFVPIYINSSQNDKISDQSKVSWMKALAPAVDKTNVTQNLKVKS